MQCSTCGNNYPKCFAVTDHRGNRWTFDSIECAAQQLAPQCAHCSCRILGHGVEVAGSIFCCEHCARKSR